ncbi:MAG TPA: response regulator transcription factor [Actinophytocola sp.]|uniref:response regulator n=1 Tax=Actinophytocola sp. TaxID=1872138 RepID=UPI002F959F5F
MGIRILLVDDHELVRQGIADLLAAEADLEVVGQAATVAEALARADQIEADVAVLDVRMPDGNGLDLCRELRARRPRLRCLVLTSDDGSRADAITAGASGFVLKQVLGMTLVDAVRTVGAGGSFMDEVHH